jgi:hypothetical protein
MRRKIFIGVLVALITSVGALGPADALAKKKKKKAPGPVVTATATSAVSPGSSGTATANCPSGTTLTGGGYAGQPLGEFGTYVYEQHASGNGWTAIAINASSTGTGTVSAEAYCRRRAPVLTESTAITQLAALSGSGFGSGTATATCPAGTQAVAGGFAGFVDTAGRDVFVSSSRRTPDRTGWAVKGLNVGTSVDTLRAYVYCAKERLTELASPVASGTGAETSIVAEAQPCPRVKVKVKKHGKTKKVKKHTQSLSGGFVLSDITFQSGGQGPLPFSSTRLTNGWRAGAAEISGGTGTATSFAYCGV